MNVNLFNPNVAVIFGIVTAVCFVMLTDRLVRKQQQRLYVSLLLASLCGALLLNVLLHMFFPFDALPAWLWLKLFPCPLAIGVTVLALVTVHGKRQKLYAAWALAGVLLSVGFSLLLINLDYHYYPTIGSIFGVEPAASGQSTDTIMFSAQRGRVATIESSLYAPEDSNFHGQLRHLTIPGTVSGFQARSGWVYVPAIAEPPTQISLPVLILISGVPGSPNDWLNGGEAMSTLDAFAKLHHGITPYVFIVDDTGSFFNDTECVDSPRGNAETYLTQDVPTYIKSHYNVARDPSAWGIGGTSMGGMCAVMLTLRHPNVYNLFLDFSGEGEPDIGSKDSTVTLLFNGSEADWNNHRPLNLLRRHIYHEIAGYFVSGKSDSLLLQTQTRQLYDATRAGGLNVAYESLDGKHSFQIWSQAFKNSLPWVANQLDATDCSVQCY